VNTITSNINHAGSNNATFLCNTPTYISKKVTYRCERCVQIARDIDVKVRFLLYNGLSLYLWRISHVKKKIKKKKESIASNRGGIAYRKQYRRGVTKVVRCCRELEYTKNLAAKKKINLFFF